MLTFWGTYTKFLLQRRITACSLDCVEYQCVQIALKL